MRSSGRVMIGTPAQRTSHADVWALHWGVSRARSAKALRMMWCSLRVTSENTIRLPVIPWAAASLRRCASAAAGNLSSQSTPVGTRLRMLHHILKVSGSSLYIWLQQ